MKTQVAKNWSTYLRGSAPKRYPIDGPKVQRLDYAVAGCYGGSKAFWEDEHIFALSLNDPGDRHSMFQKFRRIDLEE